LTSRVLRPALLGIVIGVACLLAGCDSVDPTAQSFAIAFRNDLAQSVELKLCSDESCNDFYYADTIEPKELYPENISDRDVLTRWLVATTSGRTLGCLPLEFDGKYDNVIINLSQSVSCPGQQGLKVQHGRRTVRE
jgi:hypothetical protein